MSDPLMAFAPGLKEFDIGGTSAMGGSDGADNFDVPDDELDAELAALKMEEDSDIGDPNEALLQHQLDDLNTLLAETKDLGPAKSAAGSGGLEPQVVERPAVVDDFIRNFFIRHGLKRSLDAFQSEWYQLQTQGRLTEAEAEIVPDIYVKNEALTENVNHLKTEVAKARQIAESAKSYWDKFKKERDFHRMHHKRTAQEKQRLLLDLKRLRHHYEQYEPTLTELRHKYEVAMKEKFLMRLERDRQTTKIENLQKQLSQFESKAGKSASPALDSEAPDLTTMKTSRKIRDTPWPSAERVNPHLASDEEPTNAKTLRPQKTIKAHECPVSRLAIHPKLPIVGTAADDHTWKLWTIEDGAMVMAGEGHKDWVAGIAFQPVTGNLVATSSGDSTVKGLQH